MLANARVSSATAAQVTKVRAQRYVENARDCMEVQASSADTRQSEDGPLLPDNYRRTPKGKGRQVNGFESEHTPQKHQPGSIVRVTLRNFVTYTNAEFHPGPNLNMIIGPNGTGKSTLVCAICIGLGWGTGHLGRAKEIAEFVKHGAKEAEIEIELQADPTKQRNNPVIGTHIKREGGKTTFSVDGKNCSKKAAQDLAKSFNIQVDNLCQFLPQDRVVEFAALSPIDLLTHTQRAAAPSYMSEWHEELKQMRGEQKKGLADQQTVSENLKNLEGRQRLQEGDVRQMQEREELQKRIDVLETMRPFPVYRAAKLKVDEGKVRLKAASKELSQLERKMEPNLRAVNGKQHYLERVEKVVGQRQRLVQRGEGTADDMKKKHDATQQKIQDCATEIEAEKNSMRGKKQEAPRLQAAITNIKKTMENPPAAQDFAAMNAEMREKTVQMREIEQRGRGIREEMNALDQQGRQRQQIVQMAEKEREHLQSQAGQQANKLRTASRDAARAWDWIQQHRDRFEAEVFGPPAVECSIKDQRQADAVESMIPVGETMAFTVTTKEDFKMLSRELHDNLKLTNINLRSSLTPLASFRPPVSSNQLQQYGLDGWLIDLIEGPEPVLAMLCDNRNIHQTAYTSHNLNEAQFDALKSSGVINSWVTPSQSYNITRRREYGEAGVSTKVQGIKKARLFTDQPVDRQQEQDINERVRTAEGELGEIQEQANTLKAEGRRIGGQRQQLAQEHAELQTQKDQLQKQQAEFQGLPTKLANLEGKLADIDRRLAEHRSRQMAIVEKGEKLTLEKGQFALDYANAVEALRSLHVSLYEVEIIRIEAQSDLEQLDAQNIADRNMLEARRQEVKVIDRTVAEAKRQAHEALAQCQQVLDSQEPWQDEIMRSLPVGQTSDELETEIQSVRARLEMTHGGNPNIIAEFEDRAKRIAKQQDRLRALEAQLETLQARITEVRSKWEPELDELVGHISEAFGENFSKINCAGEVHVDKPEDFDQWSIQIKVKFRSVHYVCATCRVLH